MPAVRAFRAAAFALAIAVPTVLSAPALAGGAGSGTFTGQSNHETRGAVTVVKAQGGWEIHLEDSFWFDGAPDPRVAFGTDGKFAKGTDFEPLRENAGKQVYKVPAGIDPESFDTVVIWCRKFSVPLGYAKLN
ncbi:MAG: DM13 domain-containing protein [Pseudomonadota bacterium]